eukprot:NODE_16530_length_989_cov_16.089327.p1 GENE.NODE_16530_length_989_cov_16.089327~~NODE_16530_length_989_cov_16.089327.p1  ORF type:complete len:135 (-),score=46.64 NODE_16530_length_989_cov_16.089327:443-847(-)
MKRVGVVLVGSTLAADDFGATVTAVQPQLLNTATFNEELSAAKTGTTAESNEVEGDAQAISIAATDDSLLLIEETAEMHEGARSEEVNDQAEKSEEQEGAADSAELSTEASQNREWLLKSKKAEEEDRKPCCIL